MPSAAAWVRPRPPRALLLRQSRTPRWQATVVGIEGSTLLTAATALYQQAKILDNQIAKAIRPKCYQAHLITLQVNLQPVRRDLPDDAFININFAPGTLMEALGTSPTTKMPVASLMPAVIIYPPIITDVLEATSMSRSIEQIRQAAMSIARVAGVVGVNAGWPAARTALIRRSIWAKGAK